MKKNLTLVLLTHERHFILNRAISYYLGVGAELIIMDSSKEEFIFDESVDIERVEGLTYIHCPQYATNKDFTSKARDGVSRVSTTYMVFVADDDFVFYDSLKKSVDFLESHKDYGVCHGYSIFYLPEKDKVHYFLRDKKLANEFCGESISDRISWMMSNYIPIFYAVCKTSLNREWFESVYLDISMEYSEFGHAFYLAMREKIKILNIPYGVRESNYVSSDHGTDLLSSLSWSYGSEYEEKKYFIRFLCRLLKANGFSVLESSRLVDDSFRLLAHCLSSGTTLTLQEMFFSEWAGFSNCPNWITLPEQSLDNDYYSSEFFDSLVGIDIIVRTCPSGKLQIAQLQPILSEQCSVIKKITSDLDYNYLESVLNKNKFNIELVDAVISVYPHSSELLSWAALLKSSKNPKQKPFASLGYSDDFPLDGHHQKSLLGSPNADPASDAVSSFNEWLSSRTLTPVQLDKINCFLLGKHAPKISFFILDLVGSPVETNKTILSLKSLKKNYSNLNFVVFSVSADSGQHGVEFYDCDQCIVIEPDNYVSLINDFVSSGKLDSSDWFGIFNAGTEFLLSGFFAVILELISGENYSAVYADEIGYSGNSDVGAFFHPKVNLDLLLSIPSVLSKNYLFKKGCFSELGGFDSDCREAAELDFILRVLLSKGFNAVHHIDELFSAGLARKALSSESYRLTIARHLELRGYQTAEVRCLDSYPGRYFVKYNHNSSPLVSIVIFVAGSNLSLLQRCVESILEKTNYFNYEVVIALSSNLDQSVFDWVYAVEAIAEGKIKLSLGSAQDSYASLLNSTVQQLSSDYVVFLDYDSAVIEEHWLAELLNHAQRPEVGVVGSKLIHPNGHILHAGLILGLNGVADPAFLGSPMDASGYMDRLIVDQNYSAFSASCFIVPRSLYLEAGGFDAEFNIFHHDVDLCLRVESLGYLNVFASQVILLSEGIVSAEGRWSAGLKVELQSSEYSELVKNDEYLMYERWLFKLSDDNAYNKNLSLSMLGGFSLLESGLSWSPLNSFRPDPVILAQPADNTGCGNYRVIQPFNAMLSAGIIGGCIKSDVYLSAPELGRYNPDTVVLQRPMGDGPMDAMRRIKKFSNAFLVYELDDLISAVPIKSIHKKDIPKDISKLLRSAVALADRFVVSTDTLADSLSDLHTDIQVVKNRLNPALWDGLTPKAVKRKSPRLRVGWAGGASHTGDLDVISDVIRELAGEVDWIFFGMCQQLNGVAEFHPGVSIERYPQKLADLNLDLALAPLEYNRFNECKSNLRLLEYGIFGYPVICTDIQCYSEDNLPVTRVKNKFQDWVSAIRDHIHNRDESVRMGQELKAAIQKDWMLRGEHVENWKKVWLP